MAATRYGIINHGHDILNHIKFQNAAERQAFREKFDAYHASHDHDGDPPVFENTTAAEYTKHVYSHKVTNVTIDGYTAYQILDYHEAIEDSYILSHYEPPSCCVPPLVAINRQLEDLIRADTFERHELSAVFGDIPDTDFQAFKERLATDGVVENIIKIHEGKILDGWHRYRACKELGILRKLRFQVWNTEQDGDPEVFVLARNLDRRHYSASQRAQIAVHFNERFGHGGDRASRNDHNLKTQQELADQYNVGKRTISDATAVEKLGKSAEVIQGKTTASAIISDAKRYRDDCKRELTDILRKEFVLDLTDNDKTQIAQKHNLKPADVEKLAESVLNTETAKARTRWQKAYTTVRTNWMDYESLSKNVDWDNFIAIACALSIHLDLAALTTETFSEADSRVKDCENYELLQKEGTCLQALAAAIQNAMAKPSEDTWINELLPQDVRDAAQKAKHWEQIDARIPQWKERLPVENQEVPVDNFTKEMLIKVFREGTAERQKDKKFFNFKIGEPGTPLSLREVDELRCHIRNETYWLIYAVRKVLIGTELPLQNALDEMKEKHPESATVAERTAALQKQLKTTDIPAWAADVAIEREGKWTLRNLLDQRYFFKHGISRGGSPYFLEELEHLRDLLQSRDPAFIDFLRAHLQRYPSSTDDIETLKAKVTLAIKAWKAKHPDFGYASELMFVSAAKRWYDLPFQAPTDADLFGKLLTLLSSSCRTFKRYVKDQLDGKDIFKDQAHTADADNVKSDNIEVRLLLSYPKAGGFSHQVLSDEFFELPRSVAFPDDATELHAAFQEAYHLLKSRLSPDERRHDESV